MHSWSLRETATSRLRFRKNSSLHGFIGGHNDRYRLLRSESLYSCIQTPYRSNPCRILRAWQNRQSGTKRTDPPKPHNASAAKFPRPPIDNSGGEFGLGPEVCVRSVLMSVGISKVWLRTKNHFSSSGSPMGGARRDHSGTSHYGVAIRRFHGRVFMKKPWSASEAAMMSFAE